MKKVLHVKPKTLLEYGSFEGKGRTLKSLAQKCGMYPNYGEGFKIQNKYDPTLEFEIDRIVYKGTREGRFFGIKSKDGKRDTKLSEIVGPNHFRITEYKGNCTVNGNYYEIEKLHRQIKDKEMLLSERSKIVDPPVEKKAADKSKEKKK